MKVLKDFLIRLTSRKFLLAVATLAYFGANKQWHMVAITSLGYMGAEGLPDAVGRFSDAKYQKIATDAQTLLGDLNLDDSEDINKSSIVPGNTIGATAVYPPTP